MTNNLLSQNINEVAKQGDLYNIKVILQKDKKLINSADESGYTPLHWALIRQNWDLAKFLISMGANVNARGADGGSPMHCAANHENTEIIKLLIKEGAQKDLKNLWGNTPLCLASQRGCTKTVQFLISNGADISAKSNEGWTPLHYAYKCGHKEVQKALVHAGASDTIKDQFGKFPSDYVFMRPLLVPINIDRYKEYVGEYFIAPGSFFRVILENDKLFLEDFALDEIYPIAYDQFYDSREPWKVRFFRNSNKDVDRIAVDFQRQTVVGKKIKSKDEIPLRPRLGIATRSLKPEDIDNNTLSTLFFDMKANSNAVIVTQIGENTVSYNAGIQVNDIILEFNNEVLEEPGDLIKIIYSINNGQEVLVKILRNNQIKYLKVLFN